MMSSLGTAAMALAMCRTPLPETLTVAPLLMFMSTEVRIVPPDMLNVPASIAMFPLTVKVPPTTVRLGCVPAPAARVTFLANAGVELTTGYRPLATLAGTVTSSPLEGTPCGLQLPAVFQSVETAPVQVGFAPLKVAVACRPDSDPVAVTKNVTSMSSGRGANDVLVIVPFESATDVSTTSGCRKGSRCRTMVTVSFAVQPLPLSVTVWLGA